MIKTFLECRKYLLEQSIDPKSVTVKVIFENQRDADKVRFSLIEHNMDRHNLKTKAYGINVEII